MSIQPRLNPVRDFANRLFGVVTGSRLPQRPPDDELARIRTRLDSEFNGTVTRLAHGIADGRITPDEFELAFKAAIREHELSTAVIGAGGAHLATADTYAQAQAAVDRQMGYFDNWMTDIRAGNVGSADYMANRARLYGVSAGQTFERSAVAAQGVPTLPFYPKDRTICKMGCCCGWRVVVVRGGFDCYWDTDPACDHCATCLARERACNPLRVRNGVIMDEARFQAANLYG